MKRFIQCICVLLVAALFLTIPAYATETVTPRSSSFFLCNSTYLYKTSDTQFEVWFDVTAVRTMDEIGTSVIKVQRSSDGENWTTMKTYEKESYSQMICEKTIGHVGCVSYTGTKGYYYRAYVTFYAKDSTGTGKLYRYTDTIKL